MPGTNTIELYNKETDTITPLRLYRIMTIGHLEKPNEDAKYKAVLRACQPQGNRRDPASRTTFEDKKAIIPEAFREAIFEAFNNDCYVLAEINESCITALVTLSEAKRFDLDKYKEKNKEPYRAIEGEM